MACGQPRNVRNEKEKGVAFGGVLVKSFTIRMDGYMSKEQTDV